MAMQHTPLIPATQAELDQLARNHFAKQVEPANCRRCGEHISKHDKLDNWANRAKDCPRFE